MQCGEKSPTGFSEISEITICMDKKQETVLKVIQRAKLLLHIIFLRWREIIVCNKQHTVDSEWSGCKFVALHWAYP